MSVNALPEGIDNAQMFQEQMSVSLREAGNYFAVLSEETFDMAGDPAARFMERRFEVGSQRVHQLSAACVVGKQVLFACASAEPEEARANRDMLIHMLRQIQWNI